MDKKHIRNQFKKFYKTKKKEDAKVGLKINGLFKEFFAEINKKPEERNIEKLKQTVEQISHFKKVRLFKQDFPTFASFKKYCKEEGITTKDFVML